MIRILFSQPGTWYEAHIVTPEFELYGCYLAGTPSFVGT
jgi:penicillin amidase